MHQPPRLTTIITDGIRVHGCHECGYVALELPSAHGGEPAFVAMPAEYAKILAAGLNRVAQQCEPERN